MVIKLELDLSQLEETDKAYLAGLFDGEGCANVSISSKPHFLKKAQRKTRYFWPRVHLAISNKSYLLLKLIRRIIGLGHASEREHLYLDKKTKVWSLRIAQPKQVLELTTTLLPHVKLRQNDLIVLKDACTFMLQHKRNSKWTPKELKFFYENYWKKIGRKETGRKRTHKWDFI